MSVSDMREKTPGVASLTRATAIQRGPATVLRAKRIG
jgi:hypothetical protein